MKRLSLVLAGLGLAISTLLVARYGAGHVIDAVLSIGWGGFALVIGWQAVLFLVLGAAWTVLVPGVRPGVLFWGRMVRDSAGNCLPFSQVGGFVLGARAVTLYGVSWPMATASTVVDVTAEFLGQLAFATFGLIMLLLRQPDAALVWPIVIGLCLALLGGAGFIWVQKGAGPVFRALGRRVAGNSFAAASDGMEAVEADLARLYARPGRLACAATLHLLGWVCSGIGSWISYRLLGADVSLLSALSIEALLSAALSLAFVVPGYAGVQEAAFAGLGALYGLPPDLALGASILRRARDLGTGVPILLVWQAMEARRFGLLPQAGREPAE